MSFKRIKPSKQGDLDGACGFYAVVNALRALEPELNAKELFTQAIKAHLYDGNPISFVEGTFRGAIKNVLSRVVDYLHDNYKFLDPTTDERYFFEVKIPYWRLDKDRNRDDVIDCLQKADYKLGTVCIIGYGYNSGSEYEEPYEHWSVVRKVNERGLQLVDSSGEKKLITFDEIRIDSKKQRFNSARPYNMYSADIFVISRVDKLRC